MRLNSYLNEEYDWYYTNSKTTLDSIATDYYEKGDKAQDDKKTKTGNHYVLMVPIKDLDKIKEYKWSNKNFRNKDTDPEYWDKLVADIKKNGIKEPLTVLLYKNEPKRIKIGEGNHRLGIAKEIGLKELPVRFEYWMGDKPKKKEKRPSEMDKMINQMNKEKEAQDINDLLKQILGEI